MSSKLRVFVGSSSEAAEIDRQVRSSLESLGATVVGWREIFRPGDYPLEALLNLGASVDAALLIATPDDPTDYLGGEGISPRDNVLLELGMFLSHFGKRRTGILHVRSGDRSAVLPSDLDGVTTLLFDTASPGKNEKQLSIWLDNVRREIADESPSLSRVSETLRNTFRSVPSPWHTEIDRYIVSPFVSALKLASRGQIVLSPGQYNQAINEEIDRVAAPCEVIGVVTLSSAFWTDDRDQRRYIKKNIEAVRRGADIRRLFVVPDHEWPSFNPILRQFLGAGINIRRARRKILAEETSLEDMVMFIDKAAGVSRAYIADHAFDDPSKLRRGRLVLDAEDRDDMLRAFERVWSTASVVTSRDLNERVSVDLAPHEPGPSMKEYALASPVISCQEAADAKGIPLANELKSLLLSTPKGFVALHLPGDAEAALRAVKNALEVREACLATPEELRSLGLMPGTVCAVKDPIWSLPHLVSKRVLEMEMVSTNNGTHRGFYRFHPSVLLEAESVMIGEFESAGNHASDTTQPRQPADGASHSR